MENATTWPSYSNLHIFTMVLNRALLTEDSLLDPASADTEKALLKNPIAERASMWVNFLHAGKNVTLLYTR